LSEYSIVDFLQALTDDSIEKIIIRLISEGYLDEQLLIKILEEIEKT